MNAPASSIFINNFMYTVKEYHPKMDLNQFYEEARKRNYHNNDSYESMIKPFEDLPDTKIFILYYNNRVVGTSISHPFLNGYRIFTRLCVFIDMTHFQGCWTPQIFKRHQHVTPQIFFREHSKLKGPLYFTTHSENTGKMTSMHRSVTKWLEECEIINWWGDINYRGCVQSVWKVNTQKWLNDMNKYPIYYEVL